MNYVFTQSLPDIDDQLLHDWLGVRWFCLHPKQLRRTCDWAGVISSRIHRNSDELRDWPRAVSKCLQAISRQQQVCLIVPGTTTAPWLELATKLSRQPALTVHLGEHADMNQWRSSVEHEASCLTGSLSDQMWVSPAMMPAASPYDKLPIADRLAMVLAHRLTALHVRPQGNLERLLDARLRDERFPLGTVAVRVQHRSTSEQWLSRKALGWYLPDRHSEGEWRSHPIACRRQRSIADGSSQIQLISPAHLPDDLNRYLVHCVRGDQGRSDRIIDRGRILDALFREQFSQTSAFQTLLMILSSGRLRASQRLMRTERPMLSFSAVPLTELIQRRRFQSHLGRWDWEPYGLLIRRDVLAELGAREVMYGDEHVYAHLDEADQPYYQPALRKSARAPEQHWQAELEWRLAADVVLSELPRESIMLFVEHQHEAQSLANESAWPVIWLKSATTRWQLIASKPRRRNRAQTSRN